MKKISQHPTGFTLVELMVTTFVLATALMGIIRLFVHCTILAELSKQKTMAMSVAQGKIEEIRNNTYSDIVEDFASTCACNDTEDNDADGLTDYPNDTGCHAESQGEDTREDMECADGVDNDLNGFTDAPDDPGCSSATDDDEGYLPSVTYGACTGTFTVDELNGGEGVVNIDASNPEIIEVQVVVSWTDRRDRTQSVALTSVLSQR
jgi:prepilin-type N-terminal cleavage/methylation domain-containing protein